MSAEVNAVVLPEVAMTAELAAAIQNAGSAADIRALLVAESQKQVDTKAQLDADQAAAEKARLDKAATDAAAVAEAQAHQPVTRTEVIGGQSLEFTGANDAEVDRLILNAYKVAYAVREQAPAPVAAVPDAAAVQAAAEAQVAAKAELERKFRLNEISAAEYIQQSGAVKTYLESEGVSIESLKETVEANKGKKFEQSWRQAGEEFAKTPAGLDWPGGDKNRELLGLKIAAMDLVEAEDKVAAIARAYAELKRTNMLFPAEVEAPVAAAAKLAADNAAAAAAAAALAPAAAADLAAQNAARAAAAAKIRSGSSSLFGQSSGVSGAPVVTPEVAAAAKVVPNDATPQEIMAAYTASQIEQGIDPNTAFLAAHGAKGR